MKHTAKKWLALLLAAMMLLSLVACAGNEDKNNGADNSQTSDQTQDSAQTDHAADTQQPEQQPQEEPKPVTLVKTGSLELKYTEGFSVDYYEGGYSMATIASDGTRFLVIPEGAEMPEDVEEDVIPLRQPLQNMMISNSPSLSLINAIGGLDHVSMVTLKQDSCYISNVLDKMEKGVITYVGSYKEPDYEAITGQGAPLVIYHTSITPENIAQFAELDIPVLVDSSSSEHHPLARVEWVKLYGALLGLEEEAQAKFDEQEQIVQALSGNEPTGKTAVSFYLYKTGPSVRNSGDYMGKMIELAGGSAYPADLNPDKGGITKMEMEEFYARCKDADYILYVSGQMGGVPETVDELLESCDLLSDFKAVKEGNVWCTTPNFFQITDVLGNMIGDINTILSGEAEGVDQLTYFYHIK